MISEVYRVFGGCFNQISFMNISWLRFERNRDIVSGSHLSVYRKRCYYYELFTKIILPYVNYYLNDLLEGECYY